MLRFIVILAIALLLMGAGQDVQAQSTTNPDSVTVSRVEFRQFLASVDTLQAENRDLKNLLEIRKLEIRKLDFIVEQDSILISYKDRRIQLLEDEVKIHTDYIARLERRSWRNSKALWFLSGVATVYVSSIVLDNAQFGN